MQERHFDAMASKDFTGSDAEMVEKFRKAAAEIQDETINLPPGARTPTPEELQKINAFARDYRSKHKKASARQVRRAISRQFNVTILPNTK